MLKNENNTLPLKKDIKKLAVIGPTADSYRMLLGNYSGTPSKYVTPLTGIINKAKELSGSDIEVVYEQGCNLVEEGSILNKMDSELLQYENQNGLKLECFKNTELSGEPFFTKIDEIDEPNWIWGAGIKGLKWGEKFSIRWSGRFTAPESGMFNFVVKGDDGYRLTIGDKILIEDWSEHELTTNSNSIQLEKGNSYNFSVEYYYASGWPHLSVEWEILNTDHTARALELANSSDAVIFVGGITAQLEGEEMRVDFEGFNGGDRTNLNLPKVQEQLLQELQTTGKPIVFVQTSGSAMSINWENENIPAIVQLWYPGQEGGTALADMLFGDYNPSGRLPVTFYKSVDQLPPFDDYNMKGRTYKYFEGEPLFPFGYGLSYAKFRYDNLILPEKIAAGEKLEVTVEVENISEIEGDEVVQLYLKDLESSEVTPIHSLQGFKRVHLKPGEKQKVYFTLLPKQMSVIKTGDDNSVEYMIEQGHLEVSVGGIQPGYSANSTEYKTRKVMIEGNIKL